MEAVKIFEESEDAATWHAISVRPQTNAMKRRGPRPGRGPQTNAILRDATRHKRPTSKSFLRTGHKRPTSKSLLRTGHNRPTLLRPQGQGGQKAAAVLGTKVETLHQNQS